MDLSPKLLTDVQFREQWRGYNPDEVDEFLERVAAGIAELQQRLNEATERASSAERRLLERSDEDEIRRTLVLAQRTAVATMDEARAEADRLVTETEARCRQLVAEAEAQAARLDADVATRRRVELGDLADQRVALQSDVDQLQAFLDGERTRLAELLRGQVEWIEGGYQLGQLPTISDVASPPPLVPSAPVEPVEMRAAAIIEAPPLAEEPGPDAIVEPDVVPEDTFASLVDDAPESAAAASAVDELRLAREELADALRRAGVESVGEGEDSDAVDDELEPLQVEPQPPRPPLFDDDGAEPTGTDDALADEPADREPDEPRWRGEDGADEEDEEDVEDDPFLAELRRAVVDTEPLGPRDPQPAVPGAYVDDEDGDSASGGFFRRGRRRG